MPGALEWAGILHTTFASVVVTTPGVSAERGRDTRPLLTGMTKLGSCTLDRSGPCVASPGTGLSGRAAHGCTPAHGAEALVRAATTRCYVIPRYACCMTIQKDGRSLLVDYKLPHFPS